MAGVATGIKAFKDLRQKQKDLQKLQGYAKDLYSLLKEPTKGNAVRIISKRVLKYVYKLGGGPGAMINALYGGILNHFIDALYSYEKEMAVKEKLELLVKNGKEARENSGRGIGAILDENAFIRNKHMPSALQYTWLLAATDPSYSKRKDSTLLQLEESTRRRVRNFDTDIIYFLAIDSFIRAIPGTIKEMKRELHDTTNAIEQGFRVLNLKQIDFIYLDAALLNFNGGLGRNLDKYIQLRNDWALWINMPAMSREMYKEAVLPDLQFD